MSNQQLHRAELDLSEAEFRHLVTEGKATMIRIMTPQPGRVDLRGMVYDWIDSGSFEALCPWRGEYSVAGLGVEVRSQKAEKHPEFYVYTWVVELEISKG